MPPDPFLSAAECICRFSEGRGGLRALSMNCGADPRAVLPIATKTLELWTDLRQIMADTALLPVISPDKPRSLEECLAAVLLSEIVSGNGMPGRRRYLDKRTREARRAVASRLEQVLKHPRFPAAPKPGAAAAGPPQPKYLRVNVRTKQYTVDLAVADLLALGVEATPDALLRDFVAISEPQKHRDALITLPCIASGQAVWQSRASGLTVMAVVERISAVEPSTLGLRAVVDLCAAPGSKSIQAAQYFATVRANDRDPKRLKTVTARAAQCGATNVTATCGDAFDCIAHCDGVDVIILDPTCSGSGIYGNRDRDLSLLAGVEKKRADLSSLVEFQTEILTKALLGAAASAPSDPRVRTCHLAYSTCSVNQEEDEGVVRSALAALSAHYAAEKTPESAQWKLIRALPDWPIRGDGGLEDCVRSDASMLTDGFFVALFERRTR